MCDICMVMLLAYIKSLYRLNTYNIKVIYYFKKTSKNIEYLLDIIVKYKSIINEKKELSLQLL